MMIFLGVITVFMAVVIVLLGAMQPRIATSTKYQQLHGQAGELDMKRSVYYADILTIRSLVVSLLLVIVSALAVAAWGWLFGVIVALVIALQYQSIARLQFVREFAQKHYDRHEATLLDYCSRAGLFLKVIRGIPIPHATTQIVSKEELLDAIEQTHGLLTKDELESVRGAISFGEKKVNDYMTPRSVIDSVDVKEHVGPLLLDKLHRTGHSRFPVIKEDLDHVVGILHIRELLTIRGGSKSSTVEDAMNSVMYYVHQDQTLEHAMAAFVKTRQHLFIVVNEYRETVGLLSLEDVIEQLIGRKIMDEYDLHDDLRAVAARNPRGNNTTKTAKDV